jgi:hypothetical protein
VVLKTKLREYLESPDSDDAEDEEEEEEDDEAEGPSGDAPVNGLVGGGMGVQERAARVTLALLDVEAARVHARAVAAFTAIRAARRTHYPF